MSSSQEFCARPVVRRVYKTLAVGLAVFFVTLVVFKQDFRGYLAEARLTGPMMEGLNLEEAASWVKRADNAVAAVANRPAAMPGKGQLRITFIAMQPQVAAARVDELAERWLYQYLPDRLLSYRQAALAELRSVAGAARQREDEARQRLELLRQIQVAQFHAPATAAAAQEAPPGTMPTAEEAAGRKRLLEQLANLRLALTSLSGERTEEHPRVRTLRLEAAALEQQLGLLPGQPLPTETTAAGPQFVSHAAAGKSEPRGAAEIAADIQAALAELAQAASDRQTAEFCLSERMQDLAGGTTSVFWSKAGTVVVTRLGGTPRCSTLTLAGLLALVAGVLTFRAGRFEVAESSLPSTTELASLLELPVVGDLAKLRGYGAVDRWRLLSPGRMRFVVRSSEIVVTVAAAACLLAIAFEPSLARQVLADPFGALSEVLGRFGV